MQEIVKTYMLNDLDTMIPMGRDDFYKEQIECFKREWKPNRAVEVINIIMFDENKQLIIQKRSQHKKHNPWLLDKSVWGHVQSKNTVPFTVQIETIEELEIPSIILDPIDHNIQDELSFLRKFINSVALITPIDVRFINTKKIIHWKEVIIANKVNLFLGLYGWKIKNSDQEASGVIFYGYDELIKDMAQYPWLFTHEMIDYMQHYKKEITKFLWMLDEVNFHHINNLTNP